ncbi:MAG: hypothetical protein M1820_008473 [Bogoriella megaspora]|nr:MAG: hypothetical protein M1820_008473 [Bogoriella megaspora]
MHPHLHTKDNKACEEVMAALEECHAQGFLWKSLGMCSEAKTRVNLCLRAQRLDRTAQNREEARLRRERIAKAWEELDEDS